MQSAESPHPSMCKGKNKKIQLNSLETPVEHSSLQVGRSSLTAALPASDFGRRSRGFLRRAKIISRRNKRKSRAARRVEIPTREIRRFSLCFLHRGSRRKQPATWGGVCVIFSVCVCLSFSPSPLLLLFSARYFMTQISSRQPGIPLFLFRLSRRTAPFVLLLKHVPVSPIETRPGSPAKRVSISQSNNESVFLSVRLDRRGNRIYLLKRGVSRLRIL